MVNQILDLTKLESNKLEINYINGNVVEYLRYLTESLRSTADQQGKELVFISSVPTVKMDYDEMKVRQIVYNLLSNALKFTNEGDRIELRVDTNTEKGLIVAVEDTGIGIAEEKLPQIFDRFYQVDDTSTRKAQGTGIGLTLSAELVKLLGGEITVKSQPNRGTTFQFHLPIRNEAERGEFSQEDLVSIKVEPIPENGSAPTHHQEDKPLLLFVEDNYEIVRFVKLLLEDSYSIIHAENGELGIQEAIKRIPDIIISDVMIPLKDGFEVTETLKSDIRTSHIPIILLTAKSTQEDRNTGLSKGADAYLNKPFDKEELQIRLKKLVEIRKTITAKFKNLEESTEKEDQLENEFLLQVKEVVLSEIDNSDFKIEHIESALNLSKMQLYRKLKALTGMSPTLVVRDIRLTEASKLIIQGKLNVSEVAYGVGFTDPSYFTRVFKEKFGTSPSQYN